jgi:hypothetical protein
MVFEPPRDIVATMGLMRGFRWSVAVVLVVFACGGTSVRIGGEPGDAGGYGAVSGSSGASAASGTGNFSGGTSSGGATTAGTGGDVLGGTSFGGTGASSGLGGTSSSSRGGGNTAGAAPLEPPGPVYCGGVLCQFPRMCCLTTSTCFNSETEPELCPRPEQNPDNALPPCASNAHCPYGQTCRLGPDSLCQGAGYCLAIASCPGSGHAVCGCDGNSYLSVETACRSGANVGFFSNYPGGSCGQTVDANDGEGSPRLVTLCGHDGQCRDGERCCALTGACYPASDPGRCAVPPEGTRNPCTLDEQCFPELEFCAGDGCAGPGGCLNVELADEDCGARLEPVCGCNGVTYTSRDCAYADGVRVASEGECER